MAPLLLPHTTSNTHFLPLNNTTGLSTNDSKFYKVLFIKFYTFFLLKQREQSLRRYVLQIVRSIFVVVVLKVVGIFLSDKDKLNKKIVNDNFQNRETVLV